MPLSRKTRSLMIAATGGHAALFGYLLATGYDKFYQDVAMPFARFTVPDAERAHNMTVKLCKWGLVPRYQCQSQSLQSRVLGLDFASPVGLAAGFDKNGEAVAGVYKMGFSHSEIGSVTPNPQPGNPPPRVFRLVEDRAIINRYGFPSVGHAATLANLERYGPYKKGPLGINLGANKTSQDVVADFVKGVEVFAPLADYLVINVSSPNTPGLRLNQQRDKLVQLLSARNVIANSCTFPGDCDFAYHLAIKYRNALGACGALAFLLVMWRLLGFWQVLKARDAQPRRVPLLLKIAPDLSPEDKESIARTALELKIDGLIICNTTVHRPGFLKSPLKNETGGLSGEPEKEIALQALKDMYVLTKGLVPLIGLGGISSGYDAYQRIRAGASLVQLYTAFTYQGPPLVPRINQELEELLKKDGFTHVSQAVGVDVKMAAVQAETTAPEHPAQPLDD